MLHCIIGIRPTDVAQVRLQIQEQRGDDLFPLLARAGKRRSVLTHGNLALGRRRLGDHIPRSGGRQTSPEQGQGPCRLVELCTNLASAAWSDGPPGRIRPLGGWRLILPSAETGIARRLDRRPSQNIPINRLPCSSGTSVRVFPWYCTR